MCIESADMLSWIQWPLYLYLYLFILIWILYLKNEGLFYNVLISQTISVLNSCSKLIQPSILQKYFLGFSFLLYLAS